MTFLRNLRLQGASAVVCAAMFGVFATASDAGAVIIGPGETMEATFSMPGAPVPPNQFIPGPIDTVGVTMYASYVSGFGPPRVRVEVFDGTSRLADFEHGFSYPFTIFALTAPESAFTFNATDMDLSAFRSGNIAGRFRITNISQPVPGFGLTAPAFDVSLAFQGFGVSLGTNGYVPFGNTPVIGTERKVTVPEPGMLVLTACGLLGLARRARRR